MNSRLSSEFIQDVPTEELLERFGSNPKSSKTQKLFYKDGEMFVRETNDISEDYPHQSSLVPSHSKGELLHSFESSSLAQLLMDCYSVEDGDEDEMHRIRRYKLTYHLDDNSLSLHEPVVENSGFIQGRIFRRQKVPSMNRVGGPYLHWRDLNIGIDIDLFGIIYRITDCDPFTANFLTDHGVKLNSPERIPEDPWMSKRRIRSRRDIQPVEQVEFVPMPPILAFRCCWLDHSNDFQNDVRYKRIFRMTVFTVDDTVTLTEETKEFEGQLFLRRNKLPVPGSNPSRFYRSSEIYPGVWVNVFSRPMFVFDCLTDETRRFMIQQHGEVDFRNATNDILIQGPPPIFHDNVPSHLHFLCRMVDAPPMFATTEFLLSYDVNHRQVTIVEAGKRYKWSAGRSFLINTDASTYSENQFVVGQIVKFFKWRFQLLEGDRETSEYLKFRGRQERF